VTYDHIVWIVMENHQRQSVIGATTAPFESNVAAQCATASEFREVGTPSLPNYLGATSGSAWAVHDDAAPSAHPITADNLFRQVRTAAGTARTYAEAMPHACALEPAGRYAVKHNPAAYFVGADDRTACQRDNLPLTAAATAEPLATFTLVIPDLCDDTHDCPVATGDRWLAEWVPKFTSTPSYARGRTAVFIVWDEPTPMPFIALARSVVKGTVLRAPVDHFALLRTTEDMLGLPLLVGATGAQDMRPGLHV
jgi:hypothetical protein